MCFSVQKLRKRLNGGEQVTTIEEITTVSFAAEDEDTNPSPPPSTAFSSARRSLRSRVRAIQNAQRFIYCNPKMRSSHPSYGSRDANMKNGPSDSCLPLLPLGGSARSASELSMFDLDDNPLHAEQVFDSVPSPQPLPTPGPVPQPLNAYRLPLPWESANATSLNPSPPPPLSPRINTHKQNTSSTSPVTPCTHVYNENNPPLLSTIASTVEASQVQSGDDPVSLSIQTHDLIMPMLCARVTELELRPLPPPQAPVAASALRCFRYDELASACQNFCADCRFDDDDDGCFYGAIDVKVNGRANKYQDVVMARTKEEQDQGLQEWMSELLMVAHELREQPYVCKLVGFYAEDGCLERMLVYEKLKKGSLCKLLFGGGPDAPPLDWSMRMKIAYGAAEGLASLHERFPDKVLYKDFKASCVQVDDDHSSKISGYRLINTWSAETHTGHNNARVHAYRAPEMVSRGELSQKSNVWSFGVILLELLSGKQNMDERTTSKDESHNLVKWAKPFLLDEGKLFLLMDPRLHGKFPLRGVKMVADLATQCLRRDPIKRPTMREALDRVKSVHELKYTTRSSTKEHVSNQGFTSSSSTSLLNVEKPVVTNEQKLPCHRLPTKFDIVESPPLRPLLILPRCSEDIVHEYAPAPMAHVKF